MASLRRAIRQASVDQGRRGFLRTAARATAVAAVPAVLASACRNPRQGAVRNKPTIAVVGAGIAGLHCAHILRKANADVHVYEAANRAGGRIMSASNLFSQGTTTELGGEYIDSIHADMLHLATEFGLETLDLQTEPYASLQERYVFGGTTYSASDVVREIRPIIARISADVAMIPEDLSQLRYVPAMRFDAMSLEAYFNELGIGGWLRAYLDCAFTTENGQEPSEQSALNFLTAVGADISDGVFHQYGVSDERYKIKGGNQQITDRLASSLGFAMNYNYALESIRSVGKGYRLSFRHDFSTVDVAADIVVLALPLTLLRNVDIGVELPAKKRAFINTLGYGVNRKTIVGFQDAYWQQYGSNGLVYTESPAQLLWDSTALQSANARSLTFFNGGASCRQLNALPKDRREQQLLLQLRQLWPNAETWQPLNIVHMNWADYQFTKAGYSSYEPGQWTEFFGEGQRPVGNLHFAGEHCSEEFRGYMNGGAKSGRHTAEAIIASL
jgi:monoamine oxidase